MVEDPGRSPEQEEQGVVLEPSEDRGRQARTTPEVRRANAEQMAQVTEVETGTRKITAERE